MSSCDQIKQQGIVKNKFSVFRSSSVIRYSTVTLNVIYIISPDTPVLLTSTKLVKDVHVMCIVYICLFFRRLIVIVTHT